MWDLGLAAANRLSDQRCANAISDVAWYLTWFPFPGFGPRWFGALRSLEGRRTDWTCSSTVSYDFYLRKRKGGEMYKKSQMSLYEIDQSPHYYFLDSVLTHTHTAQLEICLKLSRHKSMKWVWCFSETAEYCGYNGIPFSLLLRELCESTAWYKRYIWSHAILPHRPEMLIGNMRKIQTSLLRYPMVSVNPKDQKLISYGRTIR